MSSPSRPSRFLDGQRPRLLGEGQGASIVLWGLAFILIFGFTVDISIVTRHIGSRRQEDPYVLKKKNEQKTPSYPLLSCYSKSGIFVLILLLSSQFLTPPLSPFPLAETPPPTPETKAFCCLLAPSPGLSKAGTCGQVRIKCPSAVTFGFVFS